MLTARRDSLFAISLYAQLPCHLSWLPFQGGSLMLSAASSLPGTLSDARLASHSHDKGLW